MSENQLIPSTVGEKSRNLDKKSQILEKVKKITEILGKLANSPGKVREFLDLNLADTLRETRKVVEKSEFR